MNLSDSQLESALRRAPVPQPPATLESKLVHSIMLPSPAPNRNGRGTVKPHADRRGWRRWWPTLLPGLATAAFAAALVVQENELSQLKGEIAGLQAAQTTPGASDPNGTPALTGTAPGSADRQDLERLRDLVTTLAAEIGGLEAIQQDNEKLQAAIKALKSKVPAEFQQANDFSDRAQAISCVNNMKQICLAARIWASDHDENFPPDFQSFTQELMVPKLLICPSDDTRHPAPDWTSYSAANCSYELLAPGPGKFEADPLRVYLRCPFHGTLALCDGSVQLGLAKTQPDSLETRNGVLYVKPPAAPQNPPAGMDPILAQRYGIAVAPALNPTPATNAPQQ